MTQLLKNTPVILEEEPEEVGNRYAEAISQLPEDSAKGAQKLVSSLMGRPEFLGASGGTGVSGIKTFEELLVALENDENRDGPEKDEALEKVRNRKGRRKGRGPSDKFANSNFRGNQHRTRGKI
jgi:hypothetical protein